MLVRKLGIICCLSVLVGSVVYVSSQEMFNSSIIDKVVVPELKSEDTYITYALRAIKNQIAQCSGRVERVSCAYKLTNNNEPISVVVKTYFLDYHKRSDHREYCLNNQASLTPNHSLEIVYRLSDKNHVELVKKDLTKNNKRLGSRSVDISSMSV